MKAFLSLKHWQLFLLLVGLPFFFEFVMMGIIIASSNIEPMEVFFPLFMITFIGVFFGWLYSLGINLYKRLPATVKMNLTAFKFFLIFPVVYMLCLSVFIGGMFFSTFSGNTSGTNAVGTANSNPAIFLLIFPIHLFAMFCIFYCIYFIAKALKAAEWQRPVTAGDYIGEFFLLWFYIVGVWFIQPRVNKLFYPPPAFDNFPESLA